MQDTPHYTGDCSNQLTDDDLAILNEDWSIMVEIKITR